MGVEGGGEGRAASPGHMETFDIGSSQSVSTPITVFVWVSALFSHNKHLWQDLSYLLTPPCRHLTLCCCLFVILFDRKDGPQGWRL